MIARFCLIPPALPLALLLFLLAAPLAVRASGSYGAGLPGLALRIDPTQYELGKNVFLGRAKWEAGPPMDAAKVEAQRAVLRAWQAAVPEKARPEPALDHWAGQLPATHQAALRYYLENRFRQKFENK